MEGSLQSGLFGAIEAGGTKVNAAVGSSPTQLNATARIETTTPDEVIPAHLAFFEPYRTPLKAFGVASFGPVRLDPQAPDWGRLLTTPKLCWSGASFVQPLLDTFKLPVELDTDVNAAALAEYRFGLLNGLPVAAYVTVGTGIGVGFIVRGAPIHGALHPEAGHIRVLRSLPIDSGFKGCCPYHGDCLEGLASGPAIQQRWGSSLSELPHTHVAHTLIADYLGQACGTFALVFSVCRIAIGGGVSNSPGFHAAITDRMRHWLRGYLSDDLIPRDQFVVRPALSDRAGIVGAMILAENAAFGTTSTPP
jgi:fructokinase